MFNYTRAITRKLPNSFINAISMNEKQIVLELAKIQHERYINFLKNLNLEVIELDADESLPDCVFVEDVLVNYDKNNLLVTKPGSDLRKNEINDMIKYIDGKYNFSVLIDTTLDGGDVLVTSKHIFIGIGKRSQKCPLLETLTNKKIIYIELTDNEILHLKSVCTLLDDNTIVYYKSEKMNIRLEIEKQINANMYNFIEVPDMIASNVLRIKDNVLIQDGFPNSENILVPEIVKRNLECHKINMSEFIKADGALTCCSILLY